MKIKETFSVELSSKIFILRAYLDNYGNLSKSNRANCVKKVKLERSAETESHPRKKNKEKNRDEENNQRVKLKPEDFEVSKKNGVISNG